MLISQLKQQKLDTWYDISGNITETKELKQRGRDNLLMHKLKVCDVDGNEITVWAYTIDNQPFRQNTFFNGNGILKQYNNVIYMDYVKQPQQRQSAPPQRQEGRQQAPSPKAPERVLGQDIIENRRWAWMGACTAFSHQPEKTNQDIVKLAQMGAHFIKTGEEMVVEEGYETQIDDFTESPQEVDLAPF